MEASKRGATIGGDLRERVVQAVEHGRAQADVAVFFGLGLRTVERYVSRWWENGQIARGKFGGYKQHLLADHAERVRKLVAAEPDLTLAVLCQRLAAQGDQGQHRGAGSLSARVRLHL
jgi:putative transposase